MASARGRHSDGPGAEREREGASEEERAAAGKLREVVVKLLIFLLQHQIVSVPREEEEGLDLYLQYEGIGIGQGSSGAVANIGLWEGERAVLRQLEAEGYEVLMYRRLQYDGILQALAASSKEAEALGERLATLLEEVDEEGKSIQIPRKDLKVVMVPWIEAPRVGEGGAAAAGAAGGGSSEGKGGATGGAARRRAREGSSGEQGAG